EPLFVQVAEIGMRKLMSEHEGKLGICVSYAQDARVNDDSVAGRKCVRRGIRDQFDYRSRLKASNATAHVHPAKAVNLHRDKRRFK
ncbi:MAG: hypothetical protein WAN68_03500, partial [Pseudolabrys sp.]